MNKEDLEAIVGTKIRLVRSPWGWPRFGSSPRKLQWENWGKNRRRAEFGTSIIKSVDVSPVRGRDGWWEVSIAWPGGKWFGVEVEGLESALSVAEYMAAAY